MQAKTRSHTAVIEVAKLPTSLKRIRRSPASLLAAAEPAFSPRGAAAR